MKKTKKKTNAAAGKRKDRKNRLSIKKLLNRDIYKVSAVFAVLFLALCVYLVYFTVFQSGTVINNAYNRRSSVLAQTTVRGSIISADGEVLAYTSTDEDGTETRVYPYGSIFAHVVGFVDNGGLGLEASYNYTLLSSHSGLINKIYNEFLGEKNAGDNIITTLDADLQSYIYDLLGDNEGAVIVMNPETGDILAMVSAPTFDPNTIAADWDEISADTENSVLYNRATQAAVAPGSTFKIFTLLEYYRENDGDTSSYSFDCDGSITYNNYTLSCINGESHGSLTLIESFIHSCNSSFANIGLSLNLDEFKANNEALLFNSELPLEISYTQSSFTLDSSDNFFMVMQTAIGQGQTTITPIHMALVTCAIANGGVLMTPRLVTEIQSAGGRTIRTIGTSVYDTLLTEDEASFLKNAMGKVVTSGTASNMSYSANYTAYGKTGTADTSTSEDINYTRSWFTGFAEGEDETIVVCVMIENSKTAGMEGRDVAKKVFDYYFE